MAENWFRKECTTKRLKGPGAQVTMIDSSPASQGHLSSDIWRSVLSDIQRSIEPTPPLRNTYLASIPLNTLSLNHDGDSLI